MTVYILDIETIPDPDKMGEPPEDWLMKGAHSNWKDSTVADHKEKQKAKWPDHFAKVGSLDPRLGMVCAAGVLVENLPNVDIYVAVMGMDELQAHKLRTRLIAELPDEIRIFTDAVDSETNLMYWLQDMLSWKEKQPRLSGFNLRGFDLPWIQYRSMVHSVRLPQWGSSRYDPSKITDWADIFSNYGKLNIKGWTLARYAESLDLDYKPVGKGSDILELMAKKQYAEVGYHCAFDVLTSWSLDVKGRVGYV